MRMEEVGRMGANPIYGTVEDAVREIVPKRTKKRSISKFNRAMKVGMAAVKKSKTGGKPGKLRSPKATFARIAKVAKAMKSGKKVSKKGETGVISRNIKRYIG